MRPALSRRRGAVLTVADDGRGVSRADQPKLFDRLQRVGAGQGEYRRGLGLGLLLARQIVAAHDGTIDLASIKGHGTTVTVRLPRVDRQPRP